MIGVGGRDDADTVRDWVSTHGVEGFDHISDPEVIVWREYEIRSQPAFVFLNDDGTWERHMGALGVDGLTDRINQLIAA